jgi:hypothetical protein
MTVLILLIYFFLAVKILLPERIIFNLYISKIKITPEILYFILGILLIIIAAFRGNGVDRDYDSYVTRFNIHKEIWSLNVEPTFTLISKIVKYLFNSNVFFLFLIYAVLGISTKLYAISELSQFWALSLLIYISYLFTLQDLTQIRAGFSTGVIMLSIKPLYERKAVKYFLITLVAILCHYSALIALFFWFLNPKNIHRFLFLLLIPLSYIIHYFTFVDSNILKHVAVFSPLMNKFLAYQYMNESYINIFNSWQLMRIGLAILFIWKIDLISYKNRYGIILTKLYILSICVYVIMSFNPAYASRFSDMMAFSDIILIPCILYIIKPEILAKFLVIFIGFAFLFLNLFYNRIIS